MNITLKQSNVFAEVYTILKYLEEQELKKIPKDVIFIIEQNRNLNYDYKMNDDVNLKNQNMLPETKALLFNIYRDYLSSPEQKQKILNYQAKIRLKENLLNNSNGSTITNPTNSYKNVNIKHKKNSHTKTADESVQKDLINLKENNLLKKIFNKIKKLFNK